MGFPRERIVSEGTIPDKYLIRGECPICGTVFRATVFEALADFNHVPDKVRSRLRCPTCAFQWWTKLCSKADWEAREG